MGERPRLLVTRRWPDAVEARIAERYDATFNRDDVPLGDADLIAAMRTYDVLCPTITDKLHAGILGTADARVKLIANYGAGFEHIDRVAAQAAGIVVTNTPDVLTEATADLAMTLMLMVSRRAIEGERELREGRWTGWRPTHLLGSSLSGKTLGLVGFGRIAQAVAARAHFGFGMDIVYCARHPGDAGRAAKVRARYEPVLADMVAACDVVSLHVPGGLETRGMIDAGILARMRRSAILINTARGDVVDEPALVDALEQGGIAGAGLDVFVGEPRVSTHLLEAPNTVLLPHLGSATRETREAMGLRALANIDDWHAGRTPRDAVG